VSNGSPRGRLPFRALPANAVTAMALCTGLTGVLFAIGQNWPGALACVIGAGVLDGLDGRLARLLKANSRFGAELDSLSDVTAFGVVPTIIIFLWSLKDAPQPLGWVAALALAVCCALRLARFNSMLDADEQPRKKAGFLTGVPAPAGAGLTFVPAYLWLVTGGEPIFRSWFVVLPWAVFIALLMISNVPTYGWSSLRIRSSYRLFALAGVALVGAALLTEPWLSLLGISIVYLALIPFSVLSYAKVRRRREARPARGPVAATGRDIAG
jgi:CDP-diacylglycerol---serine O-phosphatidyltransferase